MDCDEAHYIDACLKNAQQWCGEIQFHCWYPLPFMHDKLNTKWSEHTQSYVERGKCLQCMLDVQW